MNTIFKAAAAAGVATFFASKVDAKLPADFLATQPDLRRALVSAATAGAVFWAITKVA